MSKKAVAKTVEESSPSPKVRNYTSDIGQMTNIVLAFADANGLQAQMLGAQTETEREFRLFLYSNPGSDTGHLDVALTEEGFKVTVELVSSLPEVAQHRDVSASLLAYIAKQL